jgi:hypothetical protein
MIDSAIAGIRRIASGSERHVTKIIEWLAIEFFFSFAIMITKDVKRRKKCRFILVATES